MKHGERLKQRRIELGLSMVEVADKLNTTKQNVYNIENRDNLTMGTLAMFAKVYHCSPAYLMGEITIEESNTVLESEEVLKAYLRADENIRAAVRKLLDVGAVQ